jgi:ABC-type branched-subunit amino acid transport system substrate-binding protein
MNDTRPTLHRRGLFWSVLIVAGAMMAAICLLAACSSNKSTTGDKTPSSTATAGASPTAGTPQASGPVITKDEILKKDPGVTKHAELEWGSMFEESGPLSGFGQPSEDGLKMAVKDINDAGGFQVGDTIYTIKLLSHDTKSTTQDAIAVATELIRDDHVKIVFGPAAVGDPESTAITQAQHVLHICPCPQRELTSLSTLDKAQNENKWAFQTLSAPSKFLPPGALNTKKEHPDFTTFATICVDSETGKAFCKFFSDAYTAAGFRKTGEVTFPNGTSDFTPFLTRLKNEGNPDILLNFTDAGIDQLALIRDSVKIDIGKFYIAVALPYDLFESLVGGAGIRTKYVSAGAAPRNSAIYTSDKSRDFFENKYKPFTSNGQLPPAAFAAMLTYDPAFMLLAAMQKANSVDDPNKIAAALLTIHYDGYGEDDIYFDPRHLIVTGNDSCALYQGQMTCKHFPPPQATGQ